MFDGQQFRLKIFIIKLIKRWEKRAIAVQQLALKIFMKLAKESVEINIYESHFRCDSASQVSAIYGIINDVSSCQFTIKRQNTIYKCWYTVTIDLIVYGRNKHSTNQSSFMRLLHVGKWLSNSRWIFIPRLLDI